VLIRIQDGVPMIEASGRVTETGIVTSIAAVAPSASIMAPSLLNMVMRTRQPVVIHHTDEAFAMLLQRPLSGESCSILCLPLLRAGELIGVLYLENRQTPAVFTPVLVARLDLMASQIAIALDYARLYEQLIAANDARAGAERNLHVARAELVRNAHITVLANLAASIAHEINQPLGAIVASAEASLRWLNRAEPDIGRAQTGLQRVRKEGLRAAGIIRSLRALATQTPSVLEHIGVPDLISEMLAMLRADLMAFDIQVELQLDQDAVVVGDKIQLQQVILNLLNNAIEAMGAAPDGRRQLTVRTGREEGRLQIYVEDSGPGIAEDELESIFKPFYTTKESGLGMGLAICRTIAEAHGGSLTAARRPAGGSAFLIDLPVPVIPK
jgi:C4-dicarboxylate-specific signal transduction histidine kinase